MSSTTPSESFLSSPRNQRWLMWISAAVLVVGLAVFLGVFLTRGSSSPSKVSVVSSGPPAPTKQPTGAKNAKVAPAHSALQVARTFLETAVLRKNLAASYGIVGPTLKEGMSAAQWRKGNIAVDPYPANNAKTAALDVVYSQKNHLMLIVKLTPQKGSGVNKPQAYKLGVDRIHGKWLVNYWIADYSHKVQANPYSD
jgi:hypothetical protein